jgi:uncharacterized protein with FMN-binding domain
MPNASRSDHAFDRVPRRGLAALIATLIGLVLLLGFRTPDQSGGGDPATPTLPPAGGGTATPTPASTPGPTPSATRSGSTPPPTPQPTATDQANDGQQVVDGPVVRTPYGPVQVEITVDGTRLVDVQALELPTDRRLSQQISAYVAPILSSEALQAQSSRIDVISGATFTSEGYAQSLQAALDSAGR